MIMTKQYKPFSSEESQAIIEWYGQHQGQPAQKQVSELIGEIGSETVRKQMGREKLLSSVDKNVKQGYNAVDYDPETGQTLVFNDKGIGSKESLRDRNWCRTRSHRVP